MNPRSIRFQLTAWYIAVFALSVFSFTILLWYAVRESAMTGVNEELGARTAAIEGTVVDRLSSGRIEDLKRELDALLLNYHGQILKNVRICDSEGRPVYSPPRINPRIPCHSPSAIEQGSIYEVITMGSFKPATAVLTSRIMSGEKAYSLQVIGRLDPFFIHVDTYRSIGVVLVASVLLLGGGGRLLDEPPRSPTRRGDHDRRQIDQRRRAIPSARGPAD